MNLFLFVFNIIANNVANRRIIILEENDTDSNDWDKNNKNLLNIIQFKHYIDFIKENLDKSNFNNMQL